MAFHLLSSEIVVLIASYCSIPDVINLFKTCKRFCQLLEPIPWQNINLYLDHGRKEQTRQQADPNLDEDLETGWDTQHKTSQFIEACVSKIKTPSSWKRCCAAVRSLHITLHGNVALPWTFILSFKDLEVLHVNGSWIQSSQRLFVSTYDGIEAPEIIEPLAFPRLRSVTLREYIPAEWAQKLLQAAAPSIKHLDLALMAPPRDPPVDTWSELPQEAFLSPSNREALWPSTDEEFDEDYEQELSCDDCIAISPLPLSINFSNFTCVTHLHLCKPSARNDVGEMDRLIHNLRAERAVLEEWAELLRVVRPTLEDLVFDLRPVVREIWCDGMERNAPVRKGRREPGDERFMQVVLVPLFLEVRESRSEWPRLKRVQFSGVEIEEVMFEGRAGLGRKRLKEKMMPDVEIEYTPGLYSFVGEGQERSGQGYLM